MTKKTKIGIKNYFKGGEGWGRLRNIVRGYACNIRGKLHYDGTLADYPAHAEVEFPIDLLKDIHEKGDFVDTTNKEYPILEKHGLPKNFNLSELLMYCGGCEGTKDLDSWYVDEIEDVKIEGRRVHLDVLVRDIDKD